MKPILNYHPGNWACIFSISEKPWGAQNFTVAEKLKASSLCPFCIIWPLFYFKNLFWFDHIPLWLEKISQHTLIYRHHLTILFFPFWAIRPIPLFLLSMIGTLFACLLPTFSSRAFLIETYREVCRADTLNDRNRGLYLSLSCALSVE